MKPCNKYRLFTVTCLFCTLMTISTLYLKKQQHFEHNSNFFSLRYLSAILRLWHVLGYLNFITLLLIFNQLSYKPTPFAPLHFREISIHTTLLIVLMDVFHLSIFRLWVGYFYNHLEPWPSPVSCSFCLSVFVLAARSQRCYSCLSANGAVAPGGLNYKRGKNSQGMMSVLWQCHFPLAT